MSLRRLQFDIPLLTKDQDAFEVLSRREWLTVNGMGSYASGTFSGANMRKYHGYLVAMLPPPYGRMTIVSKVEEQVTYKNQSIELSANRYPGNTIHPQGFRQLARFTTYPAPHWTYHIGEDATLIKTIFLEPQKNTVFVLYSVPTATEPVSLRLFPLVAWRFYHTEMHPFPGFPMRSEPSASGAGWNCQAVWDAPPVQMAVQTLGREQTWKNAGWWNNNIVHTREQERGFEFHEDVFCPATVDIRLEPGQIAVFSATIEPETSQSSFSAFQQYLTTQSSAIPSVQTKESDSSESIRLLAVNADQFLIKAPDGRDTLLAGYHWFTDWGRDTMISLPGICLTTGRFEIARNILTGFSAHVSEGMIPNRFPDANEQPDYNTVDGTLWFVHACDQYLRATQDRAFREEMLPTLTAILTSHIKGTRYGIRMDTIDHLLSAGETGSNLTWMDAKVNGIPITPRIGKPVEINALWINALCIGAEWSGKKAGKMYQEMALQAGISFGARFVRPDRQGLYDFIAPDGTPDTAIRPNQVIAAALPRTPLNREELKIVLDVANRELLTPYGLRSLAPSDSAYRGHYQGATQERDGAYHQGTVWAWLIGSYIDLYRKVHGADTDITALTGPLLAHLADDGVGGIAEVFDGDAPHTPNGCPWQAWSVAELLRVLCL